MAFFADLNPENTLKSSCYQQVQRSRRLFALYKKLPDTGYFFNPEWWNKLQAFIDLDMEYLELYAGCGFDTLMV